MIDTSLYNYALTDRDKKEPKMLAIMETIARFALVLAGAVGLMLGVVVTASTTLKLAIMFLNWQWGL